MKKIVTLCLSLTLFLMIFSSCTKAPEYEATTGTEEISYNYIYKDEANNSKSNKDDTISNIKFLTKSYYVYGENYASISNIVFNTDNLSSSAFGTVSVDTIHIGNKKDNMKIGFKAYDAKGNLVKDSFILAKLDGVRSGKTVEKVRFAIPFEAVKVEFYDYTK